MIVFDLEATYGKPYCAADSRRFVHGCSVLVGGPMAHHEVVILCVCVGGGVTYVPLDYVWAVEGSLAEKV